MPFSKTKQERMNTFLDNFVKHITDSYYDNVVVKELLKNCCDECIFKDTSKPTEYRKKLWWKELNYSDKLDFIDCSYEHILMTFYVARKDVRELEEKVEFLEEENKEWEENVEELQEEVEALEDKIAELEQKPPAYNEIKQN